MGVSSGPNKILWMYLRSWYYSVACLWYYYMGRHSVVVSSIWHACNITVGVSTLSFSCFVTACPWCICIGIASALIYYSFRANTRTSKPCFTGTSIDQLIANVCHRLEIYSTLCCLSPRYLHTLWILIGLKLPSEFFPPIHIPKALLKNPHVGLRL